MALMRDATIAIDLAGEQDVPSLADLLGLLFAQESEFAPDRDKQRRALRAIVSDASIGRIYIARAGMEPVGMVSLLYTVSSAEGGKAAWLEDLVVRPDRRGRGIGRALLGHAAAQARAQGVLRITLLTDPDNERAHALYRSLGFEFSVMRPMRLKFV
jgi:ribosomal protein S18 acetylase RimI-like enzyme